MKPGGDKKIDGSYWFSGKGDMLGALVAITRNINLSGDLRFNSQEASAFYTRVSARPNIGAVEWRWAGIENDLGWVAKSMERGAYL